MITKHLATEPHAAQAFSGEHILFGDGHRFRLARQDFDAARGAASIAATGMQLVHFGIFRQCQDQPLTSGDFELANTFD